jgi:hypothetical protein
MGKTRKKQSLPTEESDVFSDPKVPNYPRFFLPDLTGVKSGYDFVLASFTRGLLIARCCSIVECSSRLSPGEENHSLSVWASIIDKEPVGVPSTRSILWHSCPYPEGVLAWERLLAIKQEMSTLCVVLSLILIIQHKIFGGCR